MEKIYKLLLSDVEGDFQIGLNLLIMKPEKYIRDFFEKYTEKIISDTNRDIIIPEMIVREKDSKYVRLDKYDIVCISDKVRLKLRRDTPRNGNIPIITKEQFLNGMY